MKISHILPEGAARTRGAVEVNDQILTLDGHANGGPEEHPPVRQQPRVRKGMRVPS